MPNLAHFCNQNRLQIKCPNRRKWHFRGSSFQNFPGEDAPGPLYRARVFGARMFSPPTFNSFLRPWPVPPNLPCQLMRGNWSSHRKNVDLSYILYHRSNIELHMEKSTLRMKPVAVTLEVKRETPQNVLYFCNTDETFAASYYCSKFN